MAITFAEHTDIFFEILTWDLRKVFVEQQEGNRASEVAQKIYATREAGHILKAHKLWS